MKRVSAKQKRRIRNAQSESYDREYKSECNENIGKAGESSLQISDVHELTNTEGWLVNEAKMTAK